MNNWQSTNTLILSLSLCLCLIGCWTPNAPTPPIDTKRDRLAEKYSPSDEFFLQRSFPDVAFDIKAYTKALETVKEKASSRDNGFENFDKEWTVEGPGNLGARINTVAYHPEDTDIILAGFSSGGIFKTTNGGQSWTPVFDQQLFLAIGAITFDPLQPNVVYAGTGDPNISGFPFIGDGIYKSTDTGETWTYIGLKETRIISRIIVHPTNSDILYVAAMGLPFLPNTDKGLYKSIDGGQTWQQILFLGEETGVIDVVLDAQNPEFLYAAGWDRIRNSKFSQTAGLGAKIHRSTDGGQTWQTLSHILPQGKQSRIGLATSQDAVFTVYIDSLHNFNGIYRSFDQGSTWEEVPTDLSVANSLRGFGWYFGQIRVNPMDKNDISILGVTTYRTKNGGFNWNVLSRNARIGVHVDHHDLVYHPSGKMLLATDGGLYESEDAGVDWTDIENIPANQTYRVAFNPHLPEAYYGGFQDNGSAAGNATTINTWEKYRGSDGFQTVFHPTEPTIFYAESQRGNIQVTRDGGVSWRGATDGIEPGDRRGWDMPYIMSPHNPSVLYTGTHRVYKSTAGSIPNWQTISEDLTDGEIYERPQSISTISLSPINSTLLYVGTMDANVWRTSNNGDTWESIQGILPERAVTDIVSSPDIEEAVFVAYSGYKDNDNTPRIYRSSNRGDSWQNIAGDLPQLAVNALVVPQGYNDQVVFAATDGGVYGTLDGGTHWERLGTNMPIVAAYDLVWNTGINTLSVGTFARSILSYSLDGIVEPPNNTLSSVSALPNSNQALLLYPNPVKDVLNLSFYNSNANELLTIAIFDINGQEVLHFNSMVNQDAFIQKQVGMLEAGVYILKIGGRYSTRSVQFVKM